MATIKSCPNLSIKEIQELPPDTPSVILAQKILRKRLGFLRCKPVCVECICEFPPGENPDHIFHTLSDFIEIVDKARIELGAKTGKVPGTFELMYGSGPDIQAFWGTQFYMGMWFDCRVIEFETFQCNTIPNATNWFVKNFPESLLEDPTNAEIIEDSR